MKHANQEVQDGVLAMNPQRYPPLYEGELQVQACDQPWWQKRLTIIFLVIGLSCLDAVTLYTVIDTVMVENQYISKFMVGGISLALNFIPLIAGHLIQKKYYGLSRIPIWMLAALAVTFLLLFATTFYLRWETRELNFSGAESLIVDSAAINTFNSPSVDQNSAVATALTFLLGILPLITSIINLYLGFISDDPILRKINKLRLRRIELSETLSDLEAARCEMERDRTGQLMALEADRFMCAKAEIMSRCANMKSYARLRLAEKLGQPDQISKLIEEQVLPAGNPKLALLEGGGL